LPPIIELEDTVINSSLPLSEPTLGKVFSPSVLLACGTTFPLALLTPLTPMTGKVNSIFCSLVEPYPFCILGFIGLITFAVIV
jgi:hypothetical protein